MKNTGVNNIQLHGNLERNQRWEVPLNLRTASVRRSVLLCLGIHGSQRWLRGKRVGRTSLTLPVLLSDSKRASLINHCPSSNLCSYSS